MESNTEVIPTVKLKCVVLGDGGVGKTSTIKRYVEDRFESRYAETIGVTFSLKKLKGINIDGKTYDIIIVLWDLAGQQTYAELRKRYTTGSDMATFIFDVTRPTSFLNLINWYDKLKTTSKDIPLAFIANKIDRDEDRLVPNDCGEMIHRWLGASYYECSAKSNINVDQVFVELAKNAAKRQLIRKERERKELIIDTLPEDVIESRSMNTLLEMSLDELKSLSEQYNN